MKINSTSAVLVAFLSISAFPVFGQNYFIPHDGGSTRLFRSAAYVAQDFAQPSALEGSALMNPNSAAEESAEPVDEPKVDPCEPWIVSREPRFEGGIDPISIERCIGGKQFEMPLTFGAYHWFHQSLIGQSGGYGIAGLRNTYFWYVNADPRLDLGDSRAIGGHVELRLRETDTFRSFIDEKVWPWEAYGYYENEMGKLKAGLLYKQFGMFWDGVFFGNAPYFDGAKLDADYGLSWELHFRQSSCI